MKILQVNLNHSRVAQDLLIHTAREGKFGLICISEPYNIPKGWASDELNKAAIMTLGYPGISDIIFRGKGFVAVDWNNICYCYLSPNQVRNELEEILDDLLDKLQRTNYQN